MLIATLILAIATTGVWLGLIGLVAVGGGALAVAIYVTALVAGLIHNRISKGTS